MKGDLYKNEDNKAVCAGAEKLMQKTRDLMRCNAPDVFVGAAVLMITGGIDSILS
jgi:hypothetical protein